MKELNTQIKLINSQSGLNQLLKLKKKFTEICLIEEVSNFDSEFFRSVYNAKLVLFYKPK